MSLRINNRVSLPLDELTISAVRAQGPGGQNVNKVSSAAHLRFDIKASSLPAAWKTRLLALNDQRINADGMVIIKARDHRSLEKNRQAALDRLRVLIQSIATPPKPRIPTRPTRAAKQRRIDTKTRRGKTKAMRGRIKG
ncbi:MAG: alternative ribosome rescue aminoacyl-tRNA hydrolase ArfB [Gammaproteobacteria bacterium]